MTPSSVSDTVLCIGLADWGMGIRWSHTCGIAALCCLRRLPQADARSDWLDGYLLRGDALDSQTLAGLVAEMVLPEAVETAAA